MSLNQLKLLLILCLYSLSANAQISDHSFKNTLDSLANTLPALNERIDFTVNELQLSEFIRGIANEAGLNVNLDPGLNQPVSNNFTNVNLKDLLFFVKENYDVEIRFIGNILDIRHVQPPYVAPPSKVIIDYQDAKKIISIEVNGAKIEEVAREITRQTNQNVVVMPGADPIVVRSFIKEMPFKSALEKMAVGNNFKVTETEDGFFLFEPVVKVSQEQHVQVGRSNRTGTPKQRKPSGALMVNVYSKDSIDVKAENADLSELLLKLFDPLNIPYRFLADSEDQVTIDVEGVDLHSLLNDMFAGLESSFLKMNQVYWIGSREMLEMKEVRMVQMRYRTIDSLSYIIPDNLKDGVDILEYPDLNSLVLAGSTDRLDYLTKFLKEVDKLVPVVLIEVLIIDNNDSKSLATGITAGLADEPVETSGTVLPGVDLTLGANTVNKMIDNLNGRGWVNLGKVNSNFYVTLQALEENGIVDVRSTPQLSTMNGHAASMSIGRTEYYKEELNTLYGTVTSSSQKTTTYKPVEAELKLEIRPIVSGNQDVTLKINVEQSDFTDRIEQNAPPGKVSRKFESLIRVKDQEMILLGGLEEASVSDTHSGVPFLSRIPILKWFFSSSTKAKSKTKLNIFIKPTIIS